MQANWVDILLFLILAASLIFGLIKGLVRQAIGIVAVVVGLIFALVYYPGLAAFLSRFISREMVREFISFMIIFIGVLWLGGLIAGFLSKLIKGPLKFIDHVLGGAFGLLKGILIAGVIVFALLVFSVSRKSLLASELAPPCARLTWLVFELIPQELKEKFHQAYREILGKGHEDEKRV